MSGEWRGDSVAGCYVMLTNFKRLSWPHKETLEYFKKSADNKHADAMFAHVALSIQEFRRTWREFERY